MPKVTERSNNLSRIASLLFKVYYKLISDMKGGLDVGAAVFISISNAAAKNLALFC